MFFPSTLLTPLSPLLFSPLLRMAWMHWCTILTFLPWGKTRALTTFWIDVSTPRCKPPPSPCPPLTSIPSVSLTLTICALQSPELHTGINPGPEKKAVFRSPPLCRLGHNRCLLLSVPNKGAFINGWWPTWCLSGWLLFALTPGNPHNYVLDKPEHTVTRLMARLKLTHLDITAPAFTYLETGNLRVSVYYWRGRTSVFNHIFGIYVFNFRNYVQSSSSSV